jgi:hypothetical protein
MKNFLCLLVLGLVLVAPLKAQVTHLESDRETGSLEEPGLQAVQSFTEIMKRYQVDPAQTARLLQSPPRGQTGQEAAAAYVQQRLGAAGIQELREVMVPASAWVYATLARAQVLLEASPSALLETAQATLGDRSQSEKHFTESFALMVALENTALQRQQGGLGSNAQTRSMQAMAKSLRDLIETRYGIARNMLDGTLL